MCQHRLGGHGGVFMRFDDEDRPLFPVGMENAANRRALPSRAGHWGVLSIDRAQPSATRLYDAFLPADSSHAAVPCTRCAFASVYLSVATTEHGTMGFGK